LIPAWSQVRIGPGERPDRAGGAYILRPDL
jgi:hypothetical protein